MHVRGGMDRGHGGSFGVRRIRNRAEKSPVVCRRSGTPFFVRGGIALCMDAGP